MTESRQTPLFGLSIEDPCDRGRGNVSVTNLNPVNVLKGDHIMLKREKTIEEQRV